ncbi:methyltransferase domain-containing protein [Vibrio cholerae]|uniref:Methyl-transferase n=1 Tax=Vibrio cholerae O37 TaxID=185332 RepID=Q8L350_VIBCL|nr:methyltransferase domain-containing protein [Vibrio cholerae]AAM22593.1 methyl-transferase [Vibrio cholerae O37]EGR0494297.1 class I SAM-dependent methyltransferase [Vibrio cholerae]EGR0557304.1 class I SAM-dependent methyltransferase [Vibrio cholerae]EGR0679985.1 methyltransferase domain-containing protein [Vibrio cholerae]EGR1035807.1 methyltransferase domain-containing protein [Vibrio cholerae]
MSDLKNVYDSVYAENDNYNFHYPAKDLIVDLYATQICGKILDAGCGQGGNLKRLLSHGVDAFGIELSSVCCEKHLQALPHENTDIVSFSQKSIIEFDGLVCFDVLEHIPESSLDENIKALSSLSKSALLGIANHSDIQCGEELHLIQEDVDWWIARLKQHYESATCVVSFLDDTFFVIEVSNLGEEALKLNLQYKRILSFSHEYDVLWKMKDKYEHESASKSNEIDKLIELQKQLSSQIVDLKEELGATRASYLNILNSKDISISNMLRKLLGRPVWK